MGALALPLAFGHRSVAVQIDDMGRPWFRADDVCSALEFTNSRKAVADHCDEDDVTKRDTIDALGRTQKTNFVNESGVYALIFGSRKPVAKKFKKWVTSEVLPAIRQNGFYQVPQAVEPDPRAEEIEDLRQRPVSPKAEERRELALAVLAFVEEALVIGATKKDAIAEASDLFGCAPSTIWAYMRVVRTVPERDRPLALTPQYTGGGRLAECHPQAWEHLCRLAARNGAKIGTCIGTTLKRARREGWEPMPHERTLRRRLKAMRGLPVPARSRSIGGREQ